MSRPLRRWRIPYPPVCLSLGIAQWLGEGEESGCHALALAQYTDCLETPHLGAAGAGR
jgi:hypothetical protein